MTLVWAEWGRCGHALEACQGSLEMEGGTQHWRPVKALKRSEEMEGGIQEKHLRDFTDAAHGGVGG